MGRVFPTVEQQRETRRVEQQRVFWERLSAAGFTPDDMQGWIANRIRVIRDNSRTVAAEG